MPVKVPCTLSVRDEVQPRVGDTPLIQSYPLGGLGSICFRFASQNSCTLRDVEGGVGKGEEGRKELRCQTTVERDMCPWLCGSHI